MRGIAVPENLSRILPILPLLLTLGCSGGQSESPPSEGAGGHPWKAQTEALDRAKGVQQSLDEASDRGRKAIDEQGR